MTLETHLFANEKSGLKTADSEGLYNQLSKAVSQAVNEQLPFYLCSNRLFWLNLVLSIYKGVFSLFFLYNI